MEGNYISELKELILKPPNSETDSKIKDILRVILSKGGGEELNIADALSSLLKSRDIEIQLLVAQTIAELSKCEANRVTYAQKNIINSLLEFVKAPIDANNIELIKQTCRALGNVCCDSSAGRDAIVQEKGLPALVELLPKTIHHLDKTDESYSSLRLCACKLFINFFLGGSDYIKLALDVGFESNIFEILRFEFELKDKNEDCLSTALLVITIILDNTPSLILDKGINLLVVEILKETKNIEISEMCLEHLHAQAEHDEVKNVLSRAEVPQLLWSLLQEHRSLAVDEETRQLMKLACNLIVLILTGDDSMHLLYSEGTGEMFLNMVGWLDSDDLELVTTAVMAIGNFARTDTHCVYMMDSGVFDKLLSLLVAHKNQEDDIRLQHAVLSGLRNLVITQRNKPLAIERGILPILIEMLPNVTQYQVIFKLLATLRMLVGGQDIVAEQLVNSGILAQVSHWGTRVEHVGAAGEAPRLLAWIVRQLHTIKNISKFIEIDGCVSCLVNMLVGAHATMQNEAIISLTILCVTCLALDSPQQENINHEPNDCPRQVDDKTNNNPTLKKLVDEFIKAEVGKQIVLMIDNNVFRMHPELAKNFCQFLLTLTKLKLLNEHLYDNSIHVSLEKLLTESMDSTLLDVVKLPIGNVISEIKTSSDK